MKKVDVFVKGPGSGRETAIRSLQAAGLEVGSIQDVTPRRTTAAVRRSAAASDARARLATARLARFPGGTAPSQAVPPVPLQYPQSDHAVSSGVI